MQRYCKSYKLSKFRQFSGWNEQLKEEDSRLSSEFLCYLWDDFTVGTTSIAETEIIFNDVTMEWQEFCKESLNFHIPEFFSHNLAAKNLAISDEQLMKTYPIPILPIHLHCLAIPDEDPHIFNLSSLLEVHSVLNYNALSDAISAIISYHDMLRLRFIYSPVAGWRTYIAEADKQVPLTCIDLINVGYEQQSVLIEDEIAKHQCTLNLSKGPLVRVIYFYSGDNHPGRLLFIIHHFACDAFSLGFIKEDFLTAYQQLNDGIPLHLPAKTTTVQDYAERLIAYAQSNELLQEMNYWITETRRQVAPIPVDHPTGVSTAATKQFFTTEICESETRALFALAKYRISMHDILLTALFQTHACWTGNRTMLVELINHGRDAIFKEVNLLHTVGWLNHITPFLLNISQEDSLRDILFIVKEQYNNIPNKGIGYGLLRHLSVLEIRKQLQFLPSPQLYLNYLGRYPSRKTRNTELFWPADEIIKASESKRRIDPVFIKIYGKVVESCLILKWEYQANIYEQTTIEKLNQYFVETLQEIPKTF